LRDIYALGYSGLDNYLDYRNTNIKGLSNREALVSQGMDAAAAIICNGKIVGACAEERFTNKKHTGDFPKHAIDACLKKAGISIDDVSYIAHNFNYEPYKELLKQSDYSKGLYEAILSDQSQINLFKKYYGVDISNRLKSYDHHDCHATYTFETSGFRKSLIIVMDGLGEYNSISVYKGDVEGLTLLRSYGPTCSLGMLYSAVTDYLGFIPNSDEYKIMGLAAYGNKNTYKELFDEVIELSDNGNIQIKNIIPSKIADPKDRETFRYFNKWLSSRIFPKRGHEDSVEQCHKDLAAALQDGLNKAMEHLVRYWKNQTNLDNLCMSGGVALNCVANAHIAAQKLFCGLYIAPASADDGTALGAAMVVMIREGYSLDKKHCIDMPFYGPSIEVDDHNNLLLRNKLTKESLGDQELIAVVADAIIEGKIVAWAQGEMEFGPRALGHRSILADPREYEMRERLNAVTKQRESFRPFAPIVKEEALREYFEVEDGVVYKHMLVHRFLNKSILDCDSTRHFIHFFHFISPRK
jgi:carbamoyltransferase